MNGVGTGPAAVISATPSGAPSVALNALPPSTSPVTLQSSVTYSWVGTTNGAAISRYDVWVKRAAYGTALPATWIRIASTTGNSIALAIGRGESLSVSVQAIDVRGNGGALSAASAVVSSPLTVSSMTVSQGWTTVYSSLYYGGAARKTSTAWAWLTARSVSATTRLAIVGTAAPGYGAVDVFVGTRKVGTVNFASTSVTVAKTFVVGPFPATSGQVTLGVVSATGKTVRIQGVAALP
jgi:hypothetical protein